jgi:hypothetical protein
MKNKKYHNVGTVLKSNRKIPQCVLDFKTVPTVWYFSIGF